MAERGRPRSTITYEEVQNAILLNKLDVYQVAKKFGVSDDTIRRRLKEGSKLPGASIVAHKSPKVAPVPAVVAPSEPVKDVKTQEARHLLVTESYIHNPETDTYITFLDAAPRPVKISGEQHRSMIRAYSNWDGCPNTLNEICRQFSFPRPWLIEYFHKHEITHDREPFSAEEMISRPDTELVADALQMRRQAIYQKFEVAKWQSTKDAAMKWMNFEQNVLLPLQEHIATTVPNYHPGLLSIKPAKNPFALVLGLMDVHVGKGVWSLSDGTQLYGLSQVKEYVRATLSSMLSNVAAAYGRSVKIYVPIGSDFLHVDNEQAMTTQGTPQDMDTNPAFAFNTACDLLVYIVDLCRQFGNVEAVLCPGNHDHHTSLALMKVLKAWFRNEQDVDFVESSEFRNYVVFGDTLMLFTHGGEVRPADLSKVMAGEARVLWGKTRYHLAFTGHLHSEVTREEGGIIHFQIPSLSPADRWHDSKGFVLSRQAITGYVIDINDGPKATFMELAPQDNSYGVKLKNSVR